MGPEFELHFHVPGWPPKKNEAKSLLSAGHPHAQNVLALLKAASTAASAADWATSTVPLGLEVVLQRPPGLYRGDATNFLGGIADVLQKKAAKRGFALDHLAEWRDVSLYDDDRQLQEVRYREVDAVEVSYTVRLWPLEDH
jgi:hypothetical protein